MGLRRTKTAAIAAALAVGCACTPAFGATVNAQAQATVVKPLAIKSIQDLNLGNVLLGPGTWTGASVSLSQSGVLTCASAVICSGATQVAQYNVQGSNKQTVIIHAPSVTMTNQSNPTKTLTLTLDSPATVYLPNSGQPGVDFGIGGTITVSSTTAPGTYVGTFAVTAEYQ